MWICKVCEERQIADMLIGDIQEYDCNKDIANTCSMGVVIKDRYATQSSLWLEIKCRHLDMQKERENIIINLYKVGVHALVFYKFIQGRGSCISIL